jgi:hypothetical protein
MEYYNHSFIHPPASSANKTKSGPPSALSRHQILSMRPLEGHFIDFFYYEKRPFVFWWGLLVEGKDKGGKTKMEAKFH